MRMLGMILSVAAIAWLLYQAAGGGEADSAIPESYQQSLEKARGLEQTVQDAARKRAPESED